MSTKAIVSGTVAPQVVIRDNDAIAKLITFDGKGGAVFTKGANLNVFEIGAFAAKKANDSQSAALQAVAALRLAKLLPPVPTPKASKPEETYERSAFEVACEMCAKECATTSAWQNVKGLIAAVEVAEANGMEVYKVKNSLGYLNALGLIDEKTLKIKDSAKSDIGVKAILDKGVKSNAVVEKIREAKLAHNAEAKAQKKEVPFPSLEKKASVTTTPTATTEEKHTPEQVARMIASVRGLWDKMVGQDASNVAKLREACKGEIETLAKLGGFKLVSL